MQSIEIKEFLLENIEQHPTDIVAIAAKHFKVTRTTIHRHLNYLRKTNKIIQSGTTRNVKYYLTSSLKREMTYKISGHLNEFDIFEQDFADLFKQLPENIFDIIVYGFTEIFNNALDHSRGSTVTVNSQYKDGSIIISIRDNGIGIFQNIQNFLQLDDIRESILHLNKGKFTTDPAHHSGEGIFFTSRTFDLFEIYSNHLHYLRDTQINDWTIEHLTKSIKGSLIRMLIHQNSSKNLIKTFEKFQNSKTKAFNQTEITVGLIQFGTEILISRSQAKRIVLGLEKFQYITLDFSGIRLVGQGFVDEIFRVFSNSHPKIHIDYINTNDDVKFMIERGIAN